MSVVSSSLNPSPGARLLLKEPFFCVVLSCLCSFTTDSAGQLNVLGHDGDKLGVDGTQVDVFKQTHEVSFRLAS